MSGKLSFCSPRGRSRLSGKLPIAGLRIKNAPDRKILPVKDEQLLITVRHYPRCHLDSRHDPCSCRIPTYPRHLYACLQRRRILCEDDSHLTAPSAVHLTTCFSPDSQLHRLSVKASLPLSPLQRFDVLNFLYYITILCPCQ